jgi:hypothetical protein
MIALISAVLFVFKVFATLCVISLILLVVAHFNVVSSCVLLDIKGFEISTDFFNGLVTSFIERLLLRLTLLGFKSPFLLDLFDKFFVNSLILE